jgi:23S rRNA-/tRNA-specific pseudouridylate synthase
MTSLLTSLSRSGIQRRQNIIRSKLGRNQVPFRRLVMSGLVGRYAYCSMVFALVLSTSDGLCPIRLSRPIVNQRQSFHLSSSTLSHNKIQAVTFSTRLHQSTDSEQISSLEQEIRRAYEKDETDGILKLASSMHKSSDFDVDEIVPAALEATEGNKGEVASIMNALIGSCCLLEDREIASGRVQQLLEAYEELEETKDISPDIVTVSLAYKAFSLNPESIDLAEFVLEQGLRQSKKAAGGKRRKKLASSRRKSSSTCTAAESELKRLCGDDFAVLLETDDFVVINKPSGVPCFHKKATTAGKIRKGKGKKDLSASVDISLEDALLNCNVPLSTLNPEALGLVHRLDRGSSGCMVVAKTDKMHATLVSEFFLRRTKKKYLTIVAPAPDPSVPEEGFIDLPVDERPARSKYRVVERCGTAAALLEFDIYTGRKHQVRVHAAEGLSCPVLLDTLYKIDEDEGSGLENLVEIDGSKQQFFLHASSLSIPEFGIDVEAPLPSWWDATVSSLKEI